MLCPKCQYDKSRVFDTRAHDAYVRRRRGCLACDHRFTTYEILADRIGIYADSGKGARFAVVPKHEAGDVLVAARYLFGGEE